MKRPRPKVSRTIRVDARVLDGLLGALVNALGAAELSDPFQTADEVDRWRLRLGLRRKDYGLRDPEPRHRSEPMSEALDCFYAKSALEALRGTLRIHRATEKTRA